MREFDQTIETVMLRLPFGLAITRRKTKMEIRDYWQRHLAQMPAMAGAPPRPWGLPREQRQVCSNPADHGR